MTSSSCIGREIRAKIGDLKKGGRFGVRGVVQVLVRYGITYQYRYNYFCENGGSMYGMLQYVTSY